SGVPAALVTEALLALVAFGPPTVAMGALFSHLCREASAAGIAFGRALGVNTLAAAAAPALCGVVAVPVLGRLAALPALVAGSPAATARRAWTTPYVSVPAGTMLAVALFAPPLVLVDVPKGGHVVDYREGVMAAVSVVDDGDGVLRLRINDRQ